MISLFRFMPLHHLFLKKKRRQRKKQRGHHNVWSQTLLTFHASLWVKWGSVTWPGVTNWSGNKHGLFFKSLNILENEGEEKKHFSVPKDHIQKKLDTRHVHFQKLLSQTALLPNRAGLESRIGLVTGLPDSNLPSLPKNWLQGKRPYQGLKTHWFPIYLWWARVGWLAMIVKLYNSGVYIFVSFLHPSNKSSPTTMGNLIPSGCRVVLEFSPTCKVRKRD